MDEATLLKILKEEETDAASYYTSELAIAQSDAMDRFHARPYGDEESGRSKVVTHDVEDTINWLMPMLMRTFASSDDLIVVDDDGLPDNDPSLKEAADYLRHAWFKDNDGTGILHDFAFDALLQKVGIVRAYWEDPQPRPPRLLEGLTADQLQKYMTDPEYELLAMQEDGPGPSRSTRARSTRRRGATRAARATAATATGSRAPAHRPRLRPRTRASRPSRIRARTQWRQWRRPSRSWRRRRLPRRRSLASWRSRAA